MKTDLAKSGNQYANALIELTSSGNDEAVLSDLETINKAMSDTPDFGVILNHPSVSGADKKAMLVKIFGGKIQELSLRLLEMLCDKRRLELLPHVENAYRRLLRARKNIVSADIVSAEALSEQDQKLLRAKLTEKIGKSLEINLKVDQSLIGGLILQIGDQVVDGSIKGKLRALEKSLLSV